MSIYEETICNDCREEKVCRRTGSGVITSWICQDCQQVAQQEAQNSADAQFNIMQFRLTPKGEQVLEGMTQ